MSKQILREWLPMTISKEAILESKANNDGKIILKGVLQKADTLNQNGRIYPKAILEREIRNYQKFINENRALGELDHPESSVVNLKNVSHIVREAYFEGSVVKGKIELLNTPSGKILQSLVESGVTIGISSRGVGSTTEEDGTVTVSNDFQLIAFDTVSDPSTPGAFMHEGREVKTTDISTILNSTDRIDRIFNDILEWE